MASQDRSVRRRSSKACDQCRKTKCKCQPSNADPDTCKNCVVLGTKCSYDGPSRKRGPAKGYLSELELKLHQCEALIGSILSSNDHRAQSLVADLSLDPLVADVLSRVDSTPYGTKGKQPRRTHPEDLGSTSSSAHQLKTQDVVFPRTAPEWQERIVNQIDTTPRNGYALGSHSRSASSHSVKSAPHGNVTTDLDVSAPTYQEDVKPNFSGPQSGRFSSPHQSPHQRRRIDPSPHLRTRLWVNANSESHSDHNSVYDASSDDDNMADELGQLSLNEHRQLRYHGKASGLHLLCHSSRDDNRQRNGIWNFPQAGVWPPLPGASTSGQHDDLYFLPSAHVQEHLLSMYFTFVQPALPILHEAQFMEAFYRAKVSNGPAPILLLAIFAVASRYSERDSPLPPNGHMWPAGDGYAQQVRALLATGGFASRLPTCQALLLLGYRDIGVGAMARAWMYIGMAIRMAQDLGLHRSLSKLQSNAASLFTPQEQESRNRTWYALVHMDRYVSSYIGRPLSISERDFDTPLPELIDTEKAEMTQLGLSQDCQSELSVTAAEAGQVICFRAAAGLSSIISEILETLYAVRPTVPSRSAQGSALEQRLDLWYLDLEPCLRFEPTKKATVPAYVLTLHMQYWSSVLLVHRARASGTSVSSPSASPDDGNSNFSRQRRAFDMCSNAANRISSLVSVFMEHYSMKRSPAFLSYYIFSSSITHVATLSALPQDVQAQMGLRQNMMALKAMEIVWPSAGRAWELLNGCSIIDVHGVASVQHPDRHSRKRVAEEVLEAGFLPNPNAFLYPDEFGLNDPGVLQPTAPRHASTGNCNSHHMRTHSHPTVSTSTSLWQPDSRPPHTYQQNLARSLSTFTFPPPVSPQSAPTTSNLSTPKLWNEFGAPTHPLCDPSLAHTYYGLTPSLQSLDATALDQHTQEQFFAPDYASYETNTQVS